MEYKSLSNEAYLFIHGIASTKTKAACYAWRIIVREIGETEPGIFKEGEYDIGIDAGIIHTNDGDNTVGEIEAHSLALVMGLQGCFLLNFRHVIVCTSSQLFLDVAAGKRPFLRDLMISRKIRSMMADKIKQVDYKCVSLEANAAVYNAAHKLQSSQQANFPLKPLDKALENKLSHLLLGWQWWHFICWTENFTGAWENMLKQLDPFTEYEKTPPSSPPRSDLPLARKFGVTTVGRFDLRWNSLITKVLKDGKAPLFMKVNYISAKVVLYGNVRTCACNTKAIAESSNFDARSRYALAACVEFFNNQRSYIDVFKQGWPGAENGFECGGIYGPEDYFQDREVAARFDAHHDELEAILMPACLKHFNLIKKAFANRNISIDNPISSFDKEPVEGGDVVGRRWSVFLDTFKGSFRTLRYAKKLLAEHAKSDDQYPPTICPHFDMPEEEEDDTEFEERVTVSSWSCSVGREDITSRYQRRYLREKARCLYLSTIMSWLDTATREKDWRKVADLRCHVRMELAIQHSLTDQWDDTLQFLKEHGTKRGMTGNHNVRALGDILLKIDKLKKRLKSETEMPAYANFLFNYVCQELPRSNLVKDSKAKAQETIQPGEKLVKSAVEKVLEKAADFTAGPENIQFRLGSSEYTSSPPPSAVTSGKNDSMKTKSLHKNAEMVEEENERAMVDKFVGMLRQFAESLTDGLDDDDEDGDEDDADAEDSEDLENEEEEQEAIQSVCTPSKVSSPTKASPISPASQSLAPQLLRQFECPICLDLLACPVVLHPCGDILCYLCIKECLDSQVKTNGGKKVPAAPCCPHCRGEGVELETAMPVRLVEQSIQGVLENLVAQGDAGAKDMLAVWRARTLKGAEARRKL